MQRKKNAPMKTDWQKAKKIFSEKKKGEDRK